MSLAVGIMGCGKISHIYFENLRGKLPAARVVACADLLPDRAAASAEEYGVRALSCGDMLAAPDIDLILNLTVPQAHFAVARDALLAGKHVYNEKPLTLTVAEAQELLALAESQGLQVGCAPDTVLGAGLQTARRAIDDGWIGDVVGGCAFMLCPGHERWHPDPEFYYQVGGGPMFDMGPYYLSALIQLLGPARAVTGMVRTPQKTRRITSEPKYGQVIEVRVPTHVQGCVEFVQGAQVSITTSFDVWGSETPRIEIWGSSGSVSVPDPNTFGGPVKLWTKDDPEWRELPLLYPHAENSRGLGVAEFASAVSAGRVARASGTVAGHALEIMDAIHRAAESGQVQVLTTTCTRPPAMDGK